MPTVLTPKFSRTSGTTDLILTTGTSEQITFKNWYASTSNHSITNLQIVIEGTTDYNASSTNVINNKKTERFDFEKLVTKFDASSVPVGQSWALSASLLSFYLSGSDTQAIGGDLAYQYAKTGNLSTIGLTPALGLLSQLGGQQTLQSSTALKDGSPLLM